LDGNFAGFVGEDVERYEGDEDDYSQTQSRLFSANLCSLEEY